MSAKSSRTRTAGRGITQGRSWRQLHAESLALLWGWGSPQGPCLEETQEMRVWSWSQEDSLGEGNGNLHPLTEEPGRLQSMESQRVGHNWACTPCHASLRPGFSQYPSFTFLFWLQLYSQYPHLPNRSSQFDWLQLEKSWWFLHLMEWLLEQQKSFLVESNRFPK